MPGVSFIPGPGDSAEANNPTIAAGNLLHILHENQQAQLQLKLGGAQLQESQLRMQQTQLENQRLSLITSMLPQEQQVALQEKTQAIENSKTQQYMMEQEAEGQRQKNVYTQQEHDPSSVEEQLKQASLQGLLTQQDKEKYNLSQAKDAAKEWGDGIMPEVYSDANGYNASFRSHMKNPLTSQMFQNLQQKQAETDYYKAHAEEVKAQAGKLGSWADVMNQRTQAMLQAHQLSAATQIELGKLRAASPHISYDQVLMQAQMNPDPQIAMDATIELMKSHGDKPDEVQPQITDQGSIIPAHKDDEGFISKASRVLNAMTVGRKASTQPSTKGTKDDPIQNVSAAQSLQLPTGTYYIGIDGKLRVR